MWVEGPALLVRYAQPIDLSPYRLFDLMAPFYPMECPLTGDLVVGTDANGWLGEGLALYTDRYRKPPTQVAALLAATMEARAFFEMDEPSPSVSVVGAIIHGRQAVIL
ncbi:MAG: hypothetical protein OWR62_15830 [Sulfobacillus thermotolerans]|nr:hypothetical protein [Sulfobacillus thermotolerans]